MDKESQKVFAQNHLASESQRYDPTQVCPRMGSAWGRACHGVGASEYLSSPVPLPLVWDVLKHPKANSTEAGECLSDMLNKVDSVLS